MILKECGCRQFLRIELGNGSTNWILNGGVF